jgi:hypothetical protein
MKKAFVFAALVFIATTSMAQGVSPYSVRNIRFGLELNSDIWLNTPAGLELRNINRGANISLLYYHQFGESGFGISSGLVLATQNMYTKNAVLTTTAGGVSEFSYILDTITHQKYKLNLNWAELPLEFSYKTKSHLTFALGAKAGYLISDKTKYKGNDFTSDAETQVKTKVFNNPNIMNYRLGTYAMIGYKWINLTAYYGLTNLFEDNFGPEMSPITVGILVRPY